MYRVIDLLKYLFAFGLSIAAGQRAECLDAGFNVDMQLINGAHRMFRKDVDSPSLAITTWSVDGSSHDLTTNIRLQDGFGRLLPDKRLAFTTHLPADGSKVTTKLPLSLDVGYYRVTAECSEGFVALVQTTDLGIVWAPFAGSRPNSLFASNVGPKQGADLQLLETIGLKVQRTHFIPAVKTKSPNWPAELPKGEPAPLYFEALDRQWSEIKAHGLWVLPVVGYSLAGAGVFDRTDLAETLGVYGPPNDEKRFINTWEVVLRRYPEITTYEFWNEPWIFGWTWAATADEYRSLQRDWCSMALRVNPHYRLLAGSSTPFVRDIIEPHLDCWEGLLQGVTHHPYTPSVIQPSWRGGDLFRSIDEIRLTASDLGLPYAYLTEGGTAFRQSRSDEKEPFNNVENAEKLVQYYVAAALAGVYMGNAQWEIGYGPGWTRSNTAFAVMTHFLEDRVPLVDIWPRQELLWGGIFANRKFATPAIKALPRASELSERWEVEVPQSRGDDETKVAVIWALTGVDANHLDTSGQLVIQDATDLHAFDMAGGEILPSAGQLVLPLSSAPVYVTAERLSVLELRDRVQRGVIRHVTPINFYAFSLSKPAIQKQELSVRIQNQINCALTGSLVLQTPGFDETPSARFEVPAGGLVEVQIPWPGLPTAPDNRYPIALTAYLDNDPAECTGNFGSLTRTQIISAAEFQRKTVRLTGSPDDWDGLAPVTVDSDWLTGPTDYTSALLNPTLKLDETRSGAKHVTAKVFTAYDDDKIYIGAEVNQEQFRSAAGEPAVRMVGKTTITLPYQQGVPNELDFPTENGDDLLQFSFGFRDRVPGTGRQMNDPWAWKGAFYDTDYSFVAHTSAAGDKLVRIWGPDTGRRNGYQTEIVPDIEEVPGGTVKITRDETQKSTLYEISIPRRQLAMFNPSAGHCRFGFILHNSEKIAGGSIAWSDVAGVFDYWQSNGSFPPTWKFHRACQTRFGIDQ